MDVTIATAFIIHMQKGIYFFSYYVLVQSYLFKDIRRPCSDIFSSNFYALYYLEIQPLIYIPQFQFKVQR